MEKNESNEEKHFTAEEGLKLLKYLGLLSDQCVEYVTAHFGAMAEGKDLIEAVKEFYSVSMVQLFQTGELIPGDETYRNISNDREDQFDRVLEASGLLAELNSGKELEELLSGVDVTEYLKR